MNEQAFECVKCGTVAPVAFASENEPGACRWCGGEEPYMGGIGEKSEAVDKYASMTGALSFYYPQSIDSLLRIAKALRETLDLKYFATIRVRVEIALELALQGLENQAMFGLDEKLAERVRAELRHYK